MIIFARNIDNEKKKEKTKERGPCNYALSSNNKRKQIVERKTNSVITRRNKRESVCVREGERKREGSWGEEIGDKQRKI